MLIAYTTVETQDAASLLAKAITEKRLAASVQVEGPITSYYHWQGALAKTDEWRLVIKCLSSQLEPLEHWVHLNHPYDAPEWIVVAAERVGEKYLSWAQATSIPNPS